MTDALEKIRWSDELATQDANIDRQHKKIIELLHGLHADISAGRGLARVKPVLHFLLDYCAQHFADEESMMDSVDYPDKEMHELEHQRLVDEVHRLFAVVENGDKVVSLEVLVLVFDWIGQHILQSDKRMAAYVRDYRSAESFSIQ